MCQFRHVSSGACSGWYSRWVGVAFHSRI
jgi:hypothetical protein